MTINLYNVKEDVEWRLVKGALWWWAKWRHIKVYGLEYVDLNSSGLFAVKHVREREDFQSVVHALPRRTSIFVTERAFNGRVRRSVLRAAGAVPLYVALREKPSVLPPIDARALKEFYNELGSGGWVAYAPEAAPVPNAIGETIFPQMLMKAAQRGHQTYIVGLQYAKNIEVRIESYDARGKPYKQVVGEVRESLARLSGLGGLEHKVAEAEPSTSRNN